MRDIPLRPRLLAVPAAALALAAGCWRGAGDPGAEAGKKDSTPAAAYVGWETCVGCHGDQEELMKRGRHAALFAPDARERFDADGCEACHGPGGLHVRGASEDNAEFAALILLPGPGRAREVSDRCAACHASHPAIASWDRSEHLQNGVACTDCHRLHTLDPAALLPRGDSNLCLSCHRSQAAEFRLPNRHRVLEGAVRCVDCHNPHERKNLAATQERAFDRCVECHQDKAGPFVHEHEASRTEGCLACHAPHGSPHRRLLDYADVRTLCLSCHPLQPGTHNLANPTYRNCLNCHTQIHGSDTSDKFFH